MARALRPNVKFPVVLEGDRELPDEQQPTFWFRTYSLGEWRGKLATKPETQADKLEFMEGILKDALVDWVNVVDPKTGDVLAFNPDDLHRVIDMDGAAEMFDLFQLGAADKKKSESPR